MHVPGALKVFGKIGLGVAEQLFPAIAQAEEAFKGLKGKGKDKQNYAFELVVAGLKLEEQLADKALLSDEAIAAIRAAIDANVLAMNLVKRDTHKTPPPVVAGSTGE